MCMCVGGGVGRGGYRLERMERNKNVWSKILTMYLQKHVWPQKLRLASSTHPPNILLSIIHCQVYCLLLCSLPSTVAGEGYMDKAITKLDSITSVVSSAHSLTSCALSRFMLLWYDSTWETKLQSWAAPIVLICLSPKRTLWRAISLTCKVCYKY